MFLLYIVITTHLSSNVTTLKELFTLKTNIYTISSLTPNSVNQLRHAWGEMFASLVLYDIGTRTNLTSDMYLLVKYMTQIMKWQYKQYNEQIPTTDNNGK